MNQLHYETLELTGSIILFTYLGIGTTVIGIIVLLALPKKIDFHDGKVLKEELILAEI